MNERLHDQLDKILALADSSHEGEAVGAVRKARQILNREGLNFGDLTRAASGRGSAAKPAGVFSFLSGQKDHMESQIHYLRQQLEDLQGQMQTQDIQLDFWRRRATDLEQSSSQAFHEAERWKKLARDTAERLWDIGHSIGGDDFGAPEPLAGAKKQ